MRLSFKCSIVPTVSLGGVHLFNIHSNATVCPHRLIAHVSKGDDIKISFKYIFAFPIVDGVH